MLCVLLLFSFLFCLSLFGLPLLLLVCRLRRKHKTSFKFEKRQRSIFAVVLHAIRLTLSITLVNANAHYVPNSVLVL